jgi:hypothetical protein
MGSSQKMNSRVAVFESRLAFILAVKQELKTREISIRVFQRGNTQAGVLQMMESGPCRHTLGMSADEKE